MTDRDDIPTLNASHFARARPATEVFSKVAVADFKSKGGRPKAAQTKTPISIRLDPDLVAALKASGVGWQSRVNSILRDAVLGAGKDSLGSLWSAAASAEPLKVAERTSRFTTAKDRAKPKAKRA